MVLSQVFGTISQLVMFKSGFFDPIENIENALTQWYSSLEKLVDIVTTNPLYINEFGSVIHTTLDLCTIPIGDALIVLFFWIGLLGAGATMAETKRPEAAVRLFVRTAVTGGLVTNGYKLVSKILQISQYFISDFTAMAGHQIEAGDAPKLPGDLKISILSLSFPQNVGLMLVAFLGSLAITVCGFIVLLTVYGRWFKIYMYMIISPLPLATFAARNTQQVGIQFLRNYIAVTLEGIIMVMAIWIYKRLGDANVWQTFAIAEGETASATTLVWNYLQITIFNMLILITIIRTANAIAKEMFGV